MNQPVITPAMMQAMQVDAAAQQQRAKTDSFIMQCAMGIYTQLLLDDRSWMEGDRFHDPEKRKLVDHYSICAREAALILAGGFGLVDISFKTSKDGNGQST